jgi:phosphohistidine swiveling domain-containing protein
VSSPSTAFRTIAQSLILGILLIGLAAGAQAVQRLDAGALHGGSLRLTDGSAFRAEADRTAAAATTTRPAGRPSGHCCRKAMPRGALPGSVAFLILSLTYPLVPRSQQGWQTARRSSSSPCSDIVTAIVSFPGATQATRAEVGGKGYSLIRMVEAGLPVPPGAVLTTAFFAPWFDALQASAPWAALVGAAPDAWPALCQALQALCPALMLTSIQRQALAQLHEHLAMHAEGGLFAVRSSSPEEDLASASFAGGYATRLGVPLADLEQAVRYCFASSLDERVLVYKRAHGFDVLTPRIAVIVQQQLDSEVAGVGFSLNPLTNDYDEAVIDANWGLGESVVAGQASPDHFVVDKVSRRVVTRQLGAKQVSTWLRPDGGTVERNRYREAEFTLSDAQLGALTDMMCRIEALYEQPTDVEWAYAEGQLHVLQARPITTYVPLPSEMVTAPGQRRRLYSDIALSSGFTINAPISPMGLDWMKEGVRSVVETFIGPVRRDFPIEEGLWFFAGGRMYQNLSNVLWLASPKKMAKGAVASDALMAEILASIDVERYRAGTRPPWARFRMLRVVPRMLWRLRGFMWNVLRAVLAPERARRAYQRRVDAYERAFKEDVDYDLPLDAFRRAYAPRMTRYLFEVTMSAFVAFAAGQKGVDLVVPKKGARADVLAEQLKRGFTGNVVVEMGIALFRLGRLLDRADLADVDRLARRIEQREMPAAFLSAWDAFLTTFGWRGPLEMDLARPRYADGPRLALQQMALMNVDGDGLGPAVAHQRLVEERRQAYRSLLRRSGWLRLVLLRRAYRIVDCFAGTRDAPKHYNLLFHHAVRRRVLMEGRRLAREGRLDAAEHIFDVTFEDLEAAALDPAWDLREARERRTRFLKVLEAQVPVFPPVIDSRGRILRPPRREEQPGALSGMAVSPGVVRGPVKVLRDPHEKPVEKGDVLVAYTTDPGWTPLFANAAAVVLEVGGVLQHGAVVAREYGKPGVVGIDRLMTRLRDGQRVEVDGTAGVVRLLA